MVKLKKMTSTSGIINCFKNELEKILEEIKSLKGDLENVNIPTRDSLRDLWLFTQKTGRIMGSLAAVGCVRYAPLARKTALIASTCIENKGKSVHVLISNLDVVVLICRECFDAKEMLEAFMIRFPEIEEKIDLCMSLAGLDTHLITDDSDKISEAFIDDVEIKLVNLNKKVPEDGKVKEEKITPETTIFDDQILAFFIEESLELLTDLKNLGDLLKKVGVPNKEQSEKLSEFAQKLNRLIGGTAAMGFGMFAPLSRKTSLLASRCAEIEDMTIRVLIMNLNNVVSVLAEGFCDLESLRKVEKKLPDIESRIDICMSAVGLDHPDIKTQDEIDDMLKPYGGSSD